MSRPTPKIQRKGMWHKLRLTLELRPLIISVPQERERLFSDVIELIDWLKGVYHDEETDMAHRLRAARALTETMRAVCGLLRDVEIDALREEIRQLRKVVEGDQS